MATGSDVTSGACFDQCVEDTAAWPPICDGVTGANCAERGLVCLPPAAKESQTSTVMPGVLLFEDAQFRRYSIYSMSGQLLRQGTEEGMLLDLRTIHLPEGWYLLQIEDEAGNRENWRILR